LFKVGASLKVGVDLVGQIFGVDENVGRVDLLGRLADVPEQRLINSLPCHRWTHNQPLVVTLG
jgi:hypothetical protein